MSAKGFLLFLFRSRRLFTASALAASHASWKPPSPLSATTLPSARSRMACLSASPGSAITSPRYMYFSFGPHAGHAIGWAWKRLSEGSIYSRPQSGHIMKPRIVVNGLS